MRTERRSCGLIYILVGEVIYIESQRSTVSNTLDRMGDGGLYRSRNGLVQKDTLWMTNTDDERPASSAQHFSHLGLPSLLPSAFSWAASTPT